MVQSPGFIVDRPVTSQVCAYRHVNADHPDILARDHQNLNTGRRKAATGGPRTERHRSVGERPAEPFGLHAAQQHQSGAHAK